MVYLNHFLKQYVECYTVAYVNLISHYEIQVLELIRKHSHRIECDTDERDGENQMARQHSKLEAASAMWQPPATLAQHNTYAKCANTMDIERPGEHPRESQARKLCVNKSHHHRLRHRHPCAVPVHYLMFF